MGISATQIAAAVVLFLVISPRVTRRVLAKGKDTRPKWVGAVGLITCWLIALIASVLIAEWWALAVALVAIGTGNPLAMRGEILRDESAPDEVSPKSLVALTFVAILLIDLIPVIIGVAIGR